MQFNRLQFVALIKVGKMMSLADGVVQRSEVKTMCDVVASFGVSNSDFESMLSSADDMEPAIAISIITTMNESQKRYICAFLGAIIAIDGDVDDKEMALWGLLTALCDLPKMSILQALAIMNDEIK